MASSGNFASINFQAQSTKSQVVPNESNLTFNGSGLSPSNYEGGVVCDFGMKSGKWYWETYLHGGGTPVSGRDWNVGFAPYSTASKSVDEGTYGLFLGNGSSSTLSGYGYTQYPSGTMGVRHNNSTSSFGSAHSSGDVLGHALDLDNGTWIIYKNGSSLGTAATGIDTSFTYFAAGGAQGGNVSSFDVTFNFGQDSTFKGAISAGGNADGNGFGDFKYSVPSGYLACSTANLSISSDIDPAQTDDDYPGKQMNVLTYTGNGSTRSITGLGFKPDLIFLKARNYSSVQQVYDSTRGGTKQLYPSQSGPEATYSYLITSFDNDGWSMGNGDTDINYSSRTFVTWCFRANGGVTSSNTDGSITSTVQANTKAGFSIVSYTGNGTNGATFGHGLSAKPSLVFIKNRGASQKWGVWHQSMTQDDNKIMFLDTNAALTTEGTQRWDVSAISDSVFGLGSHNEINGSSANYISYIWHDVEGYSKFGSFEGNANNDGPYVYTGFRPRFLFIKGMDTTSPWTLYDGERGGGYNDPPDSPSQQFWDEALQDHTSYGLDIYSNGFKLRTSNATVNATGTWLFGAWGDVPFKYNNTF